MKHLKNEIKSELEQLDRKVAKEGMTRDELELACRLAKTYHYLKCFEDKEDSDDEKSSVRYRRKED